MLARRQVKCILYTAVKLAWGCPQYTRTYILQQMLCCGFTSAKVDILSRYVKFFHSLRSSACLEVRVMSRLLARDIRSVTGKNLSHVKVVSGLDPWCTSNSKMREALVAAEVVEVPQQDRWRLPYLSSLLSQRRVAHITAQEDDEKWLTGLIDSLVKN